jgi:ABC-type transporter Mla subunit MlaD
VPAYTGGPTIAAGAVIPLSRTSIPQSVDTEVASLTNLAQQLGPNGINKNGALTSLLHRVAVQFGGTGQDFHGTVVNLSTALDGLAKYAPQAAQLFTNAGSLSQALANNSGAYASLTSELASVGDLLAKDRSDVAAVLSNLQQLFANLTNFIQADGSKIGSSISGLNTFAAQLVTEQTALAKVFDLTPLVLQNLDNAVDKKALGGPALRGRYNALPDTQALFNQVCGNSVLRFLVLLATGTQTNPLTVGNTVDTLCGVGNAVNALKPPPGAPVGPDLSLHALAP